MSDFAPWVKARANGTLYNDNKDPRYRRFWKDTIQYWAQLKITDSGGLEWKSKDLTKPNWKDYV